MQRLNLSLLRNTSIPLTLRKKLGKMKTLEANQPFRVYIFGQIYEGITGAHLDDKVFLYGMHEAATVRLMRQILEAQKQDGKKPVYLDIGTNVGMHLIALADLYKLGYGFEPWQPVRERAEKNVELNKYKHVEIFPFGLSDENAEKSFAPPQGNNSGVGAFVDGAQDNQSNIVTLETRIGDEVVAENNIMPTLIKIDVEGHEVKVLEGLKETLKMGQPDVIFEYNDQSRLDLCSVDVLKSIFGEGYKFWGIKRSREFPALEAFNPSKKYENILATKN